MAAFCGKCGSPLMDRAVFCGACGTSVQPVPSAAASPAPQPDYAPVPRTNSFTPGSPSPPPPLTATTSSSPLLKLAIVFVVIIFVGGVAALGAIYYAAHRVSDRIHAAAKQTLGSDQPITAASLGSLLGGSKSDASAGGGGDSAGDPTTSGPGGNLCRFLSLADVSSATGTEVIRAEQQPDGCSYIAHGDPADATTRHIGGLVAKKGGTDAKTQAMVQKFAGAFFKQQEEGDKDLAAQAKTGEINVIGVSFSSGHAVSEMKLNHKVLGRLGEQSDITGLGDEAFDSADGILHVRKGNTMFRLIYVGCPCATDAVKPLAQKIAAAL